MRTPIMMSAGAFEMAPLSDFTVTEIRPRPKVLPRIEWSEWCFQNTADASYFVGWSTAVAGKSTIRMIANRPLDVEVFLADDTAQVYDLVWADEPEPI